LILARLGSLSLRDVFNLLWQDGFQVNESFIPPTPSGDKSDKDAWKSMPPHHKHSHFVKCMMPNCNHVIHEMKTTQYGNAVKHVTKCIGDDELAFKLNELKKEMDNQKPSKSKKQTSLFDTLNHYTAQDKALLIGFVLLLSTAYPCQSARTAASASCLTYRAQHSVLYHAPSVLHRGKEAHGGAA
jgi:hypothetical protein